MAYVGITSNLINGVRHTINSLSSTEMNALGEFSMTLPDHVMDNLERFLWAEYYDIRASIPDAWIRKPSVQFIKMNVSGQSFRVQIKLPRKLRLPPPYHNNMWDRQSTSSDDWILTYERLVNEMGVDPEAIAAAKERIDLMGEIGARWSNVKTEVITYLEAAKSLNEAIKLWPQVSSYIPEEYLNKVGTKVERSKTASRAAEMLSKMDIDTAVMSAVTAKMLAT